MMNKAWEAALADDEEVSSPEAKKAPLDQAFDSELGSIEADVSPKDVETAITQISGAPAAEEKMPEGKTAPDSESMDKAITQLVMGKSSFGATPMGGSIKKIKDLIVKTMMPAVMDAHKTDQHELNKLISMLHRCTKAKNVGFRQVKMFKCEFFASTSRRIGDSNANAQIVKKGGSEAVETYARRITSTICGKAGGKGKGGNGQGGFLDKFLLAKAACEKATKEYNAQVKKCRMELR